MFNLSFPPPDILGKEKRRNIQHQIYLSSPSVSSMFSLATKPLSDNRPRLISGLSQKEELPDLLSLCPYATSPAILKAVLMPENDTFC